MKNCKSAYEIVVGLIKESADYVLGVYDIGYEGSIASLYGQLPNTTMIVIVKNKFSDTANALLELQRDIEMKLKENSFPEVNISIVHTANFSGTKVCSCA